MPPRYAVLFKTHFWDAFAERQYRRYVDAAPGGTVFVCLDDQSAGAGEVPVPNLIRANYADFATLGLSQRTERGNLLWWNTDYFHYLFLSRNCGYDYILAVEYDTRCLGNIDDMITMAHARGTDMAAMPTRVPLSKWMWTRFHARTYRLEELRGSLNAISLFSARAVEYLFTRRLEMASDKRVRFWPGNEVFLRTEIARAGLRFDSLAEFGGVEEFEWHPPLLETDIRAPEGEMRFVHPVLDRKRYIESQLRFAQSISSYFRADSRLRHDLARFPPEEWKPFLMKAAWRRLRMRARERLEGLIVRLQRAIEAPP